jgi:hypothetical protein
MEVLPVGAQSPVKPLKAKPLSGTGSSSTASPVGRVVEQFEPPVPQSIPALLIVPPEGFVMVRSSPAGKIQLLSK